MIDQRLIGASRFLESLCLAGPRQQPVLETSASEEIRIESDLLSPDALVELARREARRNPKGYGRNRAHLSK